MDLNNLKSRLQFDDIVIRSRCIKKLVQVIMEKAPRGGISATSYVQIPELSLLLKSCADEHNATSDLAMKAIISLVKDNLLDISKIFNEVLSFIFSSRNFQVLVKGLADLVVYEYQRSSTCEYSLLFPKHPLIAVLENKEDSWPQVITIIFEAIRCDEIKGLQAMKPVIAYIVCHPQNGYNFSKNLLFEELTYLNKNKLQNIEYIFKLLPLLQVKNLNHILEASHLVKKVHIALKSFDVHDCLLLYENMLLISLSLCHYAFEIGQDPLPVLQIAVELAHSLPQKTVLSFHCNVCLVIVASLMKNSSCAVLEKLLEIIEFLIIGLPSPTIASIVTVSVIQVLSELSLLSYENYDQKGILVSKLISKLEDCSTLSSSCDIKYCTSSYLENFTPLSVISYDCAKFSLQLDLASLDFKIRWVRQIKNFVLKNEDDLNSVFLMVSALLLQHSGDWNLISICLETLEVIVTKYQQLSTQMFALLLYKQSHEKNPENKLLLLEYLPKTAIHKYAVSPVISFLNVMASHVELKSHAIHLMLELWKKQNRCFSFLQKLLVEKNKFISNDTGVNEIKLSQAVAIKEICLTEPEKYGVEFLKIMATMINESRDDASTPFVCMALDGIFALCKAEVIELRTTWGALGPSLCKDKRTLVACRMYQFLNLVPELEVKSPEYNKFMNEILHLVWKKISQGNESLPLCAAYKTLAHFPIDCFTLKPLPKAAKANLKLPPSMRASELDMDKELEDALTYIPGYCFTDLLESIEDDVVLEGYVEFLRNLIRQEVIALPKGMHIQKRHLTQQKNADDVISKIPAFLCSQFEIRKSPALQKNLAVGVLLSYESPVEVGKDGQPVTRSVVAQTRFYEQVLGVLLSEVNIDTTEWHRCILLPTAWGAFMDRAFNTCEEARKAELELQRSHGHITPEEHASKQREAWLWTRERFFNLVKNSGKNTPTSHANSVFAIAGLVLCMHKFNATLESTSADELQDLISHSVFEGQCTETLLCAMNPEYKPRGKVFSWLLTHLSRINSSASFLVRGCASAVVHLLTPILIRMYAEEIPKLCRILTLNASHSSPVLSFYSGLGLGLFIKSLCDEGYADTGNVQTNIVMDTAKEIEELCRNKSSSQSGCLVGLTIAVGAMYQYVNEDFKIWCNAIFDHIYEKLLHEDATSMVYETLSVCTCAVMISAVSSNCKPLQSLYDLTSWVNLRSEELAQCSGTSVSLGMLLGALQKLDSSKNSELRENLEKKWFSILNSANKPTLQKLAALNGLCALYSNGRALFQIKEPASAKKTTPGLKDLISRMFQIINTTKDVGLQDICSWEVGRIFSIQSDQPQNESSAPESYSYLNEKSVLKCLLDLINKSPTVSRKHLLCCLRAIGGPLPRSLPPLNWAPILTPFLKMREDPEIMEIALNIAISQAGASTNAVALVSSYCCAPLIQALPENCFLLLLNRISDISAFLPPNKLQELLKFIISSTVQNEDQFSTKGRITIQGIIISLKKLKDIEHKSMKTLQSAFILIFKYFKSNVEKLKELLPFLLEGLLCLTEQSADELISFTPNEEHVPSLVMMWCNLVKIGKKELCCLRQCVEASKHIATHQKGEVLTSLLECFLSGFSNKYSDVSQPEKCIAWLMENIGWIKVLSDTKSKYQLVTVSEEFQFLVDVCLATMVGCSGLSGSYTLFPLQTLNHLRLLEMLPCTLVKLMQQEKWKASVDKIIDWLLLLHQSSHLDDSEKYYVIAALCAIRDLNEFQKMPVWTEVVCSICKGV